MRNTVKRLVALALIALSLGLLVACSSKKADEPARKSYEDYVGAEDVRYGVQSGDVLFDVAVDFFNAPKENIFEYKTISDLLAALKSKKIDVVLLTDGYVGQLKASGAYPEFDYIIMPETVYVNEAGPIFHTTELRDKYDEWLEEIKADGTWQELVDFWIGGGLPAIEDIPKHEFTGENGKLIMVDTGSYPPLSYIGEDGEVAGFDVDLMSRFAIHLGMEPDFRTMDYDAVAPYITSGKADMSSATFTITDERSEGMIFGGATVITKGVLVVPEKLNAGVELTAEDFKGKNFAVLVGSVYDDVASERFEANEKAYYQTVLDEVNAVHIGKSDCALLDAIIAQTQLSMGDFTDLTTVPVPDEDLYLQYGVFSSKQDVIDKYDEFLAEMKESGIYDEMEDRWLKNFDPETPMPELETSGENGTLKVAINGTFPPFGFLGEGNKLSGFDAEQLTRFAQWLKMDIEFEEMDFSAMIPYIASGKADIGSSIYITEERAKSVIYGTPSAECPTVLVAKSPDVAAETGGFSFTEWVKEGVQKNLITEDRYKMIIDGLVVTLEISLLSQIFGTILGCLVCFMLTRKSRIVRGIAHFYSGLIHGTPIVVLLMVFYYIIFGSGDISSIIVAVAAFSIVEGASIGAKLQGAIQTVDPVEIEAARSMGFSSVNAFFTVTLPQAIKVVLPSYMDGFVQLVKATAIVGYIAIQDLSRAGDIIRSRTYDPYFPLLFVALIYLIVTTILVQIFKLIVRRLSK